jgi:pectate lyase
MKGIDPETARRFVNSVRVFADNVLERCRDRYGTRETPLLADAICPETGEPRKWEGHILSNLACQQNFLRTLDGLSALTKEKRLRNRAQEWIAYALKVLQDPASGMLYWGGHTSYDLLEDRPLIGNHELKCVYPYYQFLYQLDPEATRWAIEGFWNRHIKDWSTLLFNRHGEYAPWDRSAPWEHEYKGGPLPIIDNVSLSFINTGSDLIYAGALLFKLSGNEKPLLWAKRLAGRYDEIRNETTGLGGYQFNHREPCRVRISFKKPLGDRPDVNETTVITNGVIQTRYGRVAITFLNLFETLGPSEGKEFLDLTIEDLKALGRYSYDPSDRCFHAVLADGTRLSPSDCMEGVGYCSPVKLRKLPANGLMFWAYAKGYRLTGDGFLRRMVEDLARGMGWGEIFDGTDDRTPPREDRSDVYALLGLLELYRMSEETKFLNMAADLGDRLLQRHFVDGFFTTSGDIRGGYTHINSDLPLALLHLAVAIEGRMFALPELYPGSTSFDPKVIIARRGRR